MGNKEVLWILYGVWWLWIFEFLNAIEQKMASAERYWSMKRKKDAGSGWEGRWEETGMSREKGNHNQNILYEKNNFSVKKEFDVVIIYT